MSYIIIKSKQKQAGLQIESLKERQAGVKWQFNKTILIRQVLNEYTIVLWPKICVSIKASISTTATVYNYFQHTWINTVLSQVFKFVSFVTPSFNFYNYFQHTWITTVSLRFLVFKQFFPFPISSSWWPFRDRLFCLARGPMQGKHHLPLRHFYMIMYANNCKMVLYFSTLEVMYVQDFALFFDRQTSAFIAPELLATLHHYLSDLTKDWDLGLNTRF